MAMTLRLTEEEQAALRARAALDGMSMQEAARKAVREYVAATEHRDPTSTSRDNVDASHEAAFEQRLAASMQRHKRIIQRLAE